MASNVPAKIGKYNVIDVIGRGGMGVVYKAVDPHLDRQVAIKMMTGAFVDNPDLLKRFFREAQSLASLQHPNIVTVYDLGDFGGNPYMVMQYMEGEGLDVILANRRPLSILEKTNIIIQVCNGLAYAHGRGIVHRDIKPANIMLEKDGGVKLFDFGIAHIGDTSVTKTGQIVGTLSYMSPEQVNGKPVDARSDIFSTGVVLYQLFTNHLPFEGESTATTLLKIIYDPPPPLKDFLSSYPPELESVVLRALAKDRDERYHSADEFALDLTQLQAHLKQEQIGEHMQEVGRLLERADLYKAKEYLMQVLKLDQHHMQANQLLREVQLRIKKEEVGEQIRRLRQRAEEAVAREQFETAQDCIDQALALDKANPETLRLRDAVKAATLRAQKLHNALRVADTAHQDGELDTAKQAIEEALQLAPDDPQAKALYRVIQRDWVERSRQRQLENYLFEARQDISSRKFTAALEILKLAEGLDPNAPQVHALMESATAGREQERRRKDLEAISRDIEDALNRDDFRTACQKADEGLARYPEERTLLKLKALADRQRQIEERKQFIDEQLAAARKLLQEGRNEELLVALEAAMAKIGPEPRLQSLLTIVRENVQRDRLERKKAEYLQKAKEFLRVKRFDSAIRTLEGARAELTNEPEIDDLLQFVREEAATDQQRRVAEAAAEKAHALLADQKYDEAIQLLEATLRDAPDEELRIVLAETRHAAVDYQQKLETTLGTVEKLLHAGKATEALKLLEAQPAAYFRNPALAKALENARRETERLKKVDEAIERSRRPLNDEDYAGARRVLEDCRRIHGSSADMEAQFAAIDEKRIAAASRKVEKAVGDARILTMANEYQAALDKLQSVSELLNDVPDALRSEYRELRQQNVSGLVQLRKIQIERFVAAGDLTRAADLLKQSLDRFPGDRELAGLNSLLNEETAKRSEAKGMLDEAQRSFTRERWKDGAELLQKAYAASHRASHIREQILQAFVQAGVAAVESDWRAAESLLQQLSSLRPDYAAPSVLRTRIRELKREDFVARCIAQTKRLLSSGDLQAASREINAGLAVYPDEVSLKELQNVIFERIREEEDRIREEREHLEKEKYLRELNTRLEREPALNRRIFILDEALVRYPQEPRLEQLSINAHDLWKRVSEIAAHAESLETGGGFDEALNQWSALRALYAGYPGLESNVARVTRLRDQQRAAAKAAWIEKLRDGLASSELDRCRALLLEARRGFPGDRDLSQLEDQLSDAAKARSKAQKLLGEASKFFGQMRWEKGLDNLNRALETAPRDAVVRDQAISQLAKASEAALASQLGTAQMLFERISALHPRSPYLASLRIRIEEQQREQAIIEKLAIARRAQLGGDPQGALRELNIAIAAYPGDQRFMQAKKEVETQLAQLEEQRAREREKARQLELQREHEREQRRQEELERQRILAEEQERKRKEVAERERIRAEEEERKRQQELEQEHLRAEEALEIDRLRQEEEERKRKEELERERLLALKREEERERERQKAQALAQERALAEQKASEQARQRELQLEHEREQARQRELELERQRQEAEKKRLAEAERVRQEVLRQEEERRQQRELQRQQEQKRKEEEKARKREEKVRKQAAAEEQRRKEKEERQERDEQLRREQQKLREEEAACKTKEKRATQSEQPEISATRVFGSPAPTTGMVEPANAEDAVSKVSGEEQVVSTFLKIPLKRPVVAVTAFSALVILSLVGIWLLRPHTIPVQITTSPTGATLILSAVGQTGQARQCVTPACSFELNPGRYILRAERGGYQPSEQIVEITKNGQRTFPIVLNPVELPPLPVSTEKTPAPEPAHLEIRGAPPGAEVFVGGKSQGKVRRSGELAAKIPPGDFEIKIVAKNQNLVILSRHFEAGRVVSLARDDLYPKTPSPPGSNPAPEDVEWSRVKDSQAIDDVEQYLQNYPTGPHSTEARVMLERLYWDRDSQANTVNTYRDYLRRFPDGAHVSDAHEELEFIEARDRRDISALKLFLGKHPASHHRQEGEELLDDLAWESTNKKDEASLTSYLNSWPMGKHANDARSQLAKVLQPAAEHRNIQVVSPQPPIDDRSSLLSVLAEYQRSYNEKDLNLLQSIWPSMPNTFAYNTGTFFHDARSISLTYSILDGPKISGTDASILFTQTITAVDKRGKNKFSARVMMQLTKTAATQGSLGGWKISSLR